MNDLKRIMKLAGVKNVKDKETQNHPPKLKLFNRAILNLMKEELENVAGWEQQLNNLGDLQRYNVILYYGYKGNLRAIEKCANTFGVATRNKVWKAIFDSGLKDPHNMNT